MSFFTHPIALLGTITTNFANSRRYEDLFALTDAELKNRGMDREQLVRSFITGVAHG